MVEMSAHLAAAHASKKAAQAKTPCELISAARLDVGPTTAALIEDRLSQMAQTCRMTYLKAMRGQSKAAGIKAFCQMCMGWQDFRPGIRDCTDPACPLYPYRLYR